MNIGLCLVGVIMYFVGCACLGKVAERLNHFPWGWATVGLLFFGGMVIGVALP